MPDVRPEKFVYRVRYSGPVQTDSHTCSISTSLPQYFDNIVYFFSSISFTMANPTTKPCLIIHGGAGNITRENLPPKSYARYEATLRRIHRSTSALLAKGATALDTATHAVTLFENCVDFNCGKGAVCKQS